MSKTIKIVIGVLAVAGLGIGSYFIFRKKKSSSGVISESGKATETLTEKTETKTAETAKEETKPSGQAASSTIGKDSGCSKVVKLAGDTKWEYRKCDGVWFTRQQAKPNIKVSTNWISLASNKIATDKLNAAFPNL